MTQWKKLLKSLGFSESESTIYLTALELGPSSVQDIAKKAKVSRVTTYAVIESLAERSLISSVEKGKKHLFVAESPERLVAFVTGRVKEMENTLKEVQSSIDELKLIQRGEKPVVKLYEGPEAVKAVERDVIQSKPKILEEFTNLDAFRSFYPPDSRKEFFAELNKNKPKVRSIWYNKGKPAVPVTDNPDFLNIPPELNLDFKGSIVTYGTNKLALYTLGEKTISIVIESEELAKTFRAMVDYIWYLKNKAKE